MVRKVAQKYFIKTRKNNGFTQRQFADFLNLSPRTVTTIESGGNVSDETYKIVEQGFLRDDLNKGQGDEIKIKISGYCLKNLEITQYVYLVYDLVEVLCRTSEALFDSYKLHCLDYFYSQCSAEINTTMPGLFQKLLDKSG